MKLLPICTVASLLGIIAASWHYGVIIITLPHNKLSLERSTSLKRVSIFAQEAMSEIHEKRESVWDDRAPLKNGAHLTSAWLSLHEELTPHQKKNSLQHMLFTTTKAEALISFNRTLFSKEASTREKWLIIDSLLKTLSHAQIPLETAQILVCHQPLHDLHLDMHTAWPLSGFSCRNHYPRVTTTPIIREIILYPTIKEKSRGRTIDDHYEREILRNSINTLKEVLPHCSTVLSAELSHQQSASLINRIEHDSLVILLACSKTTGKSSRIDLFFPLLHTQFDWWQHPTNKLAFTLEHEAYKQNLSKSYALAQFLEKELSPRFVPFPAQGIPLAFARGILKPIILCEFCLASYDDHRPLSSYLAHALKKLTPQ